MDEAAINGRLGGKPSANGMTESQRALELRKFFAPFDPQLALEDNTGYNLTLNNDGALDAYAENVVWRLRGVRSMISLIDRQTQYFLAGSAREESDSEFEVKSDGKWFGCGTVGTSGGLCENTITVDTGKIEYPCFEVLDLTLDDRFSNLPVVDGSVARYRFYAGTPITTEHGINIGSFFMFDDKPRPEGLTVAQRKYLFRSAANVMKHLESKREAAERRRVALMSRGIATFLERISRVTEADLDKPGLPPPSSQAPDHDFLGSAVEDPAKVRKQVEGENVIPNETEQTSPAATLDKIKLTLDHAAVILRESLELTVGGVVFLDTALGYNYNSGQEAYFDIQTEVGLMTDEDVKLTDEGFTSKPASSPGHTRGFNDQYRAVKVLASSTAKVAQLSQSPKQLDGKTLQTFINAYPNGNVWYIDDEGYFSSLEQVSDWNTSEAVSPSGRRRSVASLDTTKQRIEAGLLSKVFSGAKQIIFLPLWDAGGDRWHSGCFVWSQSAVPVFTVESEIAYLAAFTNSVMVEISRLDAITANKTKSDFISSISHEFRSPLHGILASAEFLRDSSLDSMQIEFISTIQNCGSTLLDTINHVLDYSKINSFEKSDGEKGKISNELYQVTDVALLCEDIINGMIAAKEFHTVNDSATPVHRPATPKSQEIGHPSHEYPVEVILDFENRDWQYMIQPGALRRVLMNIFGNAQKYTTSGFILVKLRTREVDRRSGGSNGRDKQKMMALNIIDSGRGMSTEYMERKLYTPFAQEDTFATGVGLGLSIVWSIVSQLGGKIQIRSDLGKGTDVEVLLPLETAKEGFDSLGSNESSQDRATSTIEARRALKDLRSIAPGKTVAIWRNGNSHNNPRKRTSLAWDCLERYCSSWYGFKIASPQDHEALQKADLIIMEKQDRDFNNLTLPFATEQNRILLVREGISAAEIRKSKQASHLSGSIWAPIGPYKLARSISALFDEEIMTELSKIKSTPTKAVPKNQTLETLPVLSSSPHLNGLDASNLAPPIPERVVSKEFLEPEKQALQLPVSTKLNSNGFSEAAAITSMNMLSLTQSAVKPTDTPLHILAVDDNAVNLQLLNRYLMKRRIDTIVQARNGVEALEAVRQSPKPFDLILMDISMPVMDGFESARLIRQHERSWRHRDVLMDSEDTLDAATDYGNGTAKDADSMSVASDDGYGSPIENESKLNKEAMTKVSTATRVNAEMKPTCIVALTGLASRRDRDEAEESGFNDFLTKPISFGKIGELLAKLSLEKAELLPL